MFKHKSILQIILLSISCCYGFSLFAQTENQNGTFYDQYFQQENPSAVETPANGTPVPATNGANYETTPVNEGNSTAQPIYTPPPANNVNTTYSDPTIIQENGSTIPQYGIESDPNPPANTNIPQYGIEPSPTPSAGNVPQYGIDINQSTTTTPNSSGSNPAVGVSDTYIIGSGEQPVYLDGSVTNPSKYTTSSSLTTSNSGVTSGSSYTYGTSSYSMEKNDNVFDVAIFLPFNLPPAYQRVDSVTNRSRVAVEMYEGIISGAEELRAKGLNLTLRVFDTEKNPMKVDQILSDPMLANSDLFFGPIYNKPMEPVASYAKTYGIYTISPLSPSNKVTYGNPYFLKASSSIETHCEAMYDFIKRNFATKQILTVATPNHQEIELAKQFDFFHLDDQVGNDFNQYTQVSHMIYTNEYKIADIEQYLSTEVENILIVTSFNEVLINDLLSKLQLLRKRYPITVFGMPNWKKMKTLQLDYLPYLNFHTTADFHGDPFDERVTFFEEMFKMQFGKYPTINAAIGYDLIRYFGNLYQTYGANWGSYISNAEVEGIYSKYDFKGASIYQADFYTPDFLENKGINVLRCERDFTFRKVN